MEAESAFSWRRSVQKQRIKLLVSIGLALLLIGLGLSLPSAMPPAREPGAPSLRLVSANLYFGNDQSAALTQRLLALDADLLLLLEWSGRNLDLELFRIGRFFYYLPIFN